MLLSFAFQNILICTEILLSKFSFLGDKNVGLDFYAPEHYRLLDTCA